MIILLFAILPLEHTAGLRYLLCVMLGLRGLLQLSSNLDMSFFKRTWGFALWLVWASASYFWSVDPERTFSDLKHDLWAPALAMLGAYFVFRHRGASTPLLWAATIGTVTNGIVTAFGAPGAIYPITPVQPYFSTIAYSSTFALYYSALALPWLLNRDHPRSRALAFLVLLINVSCALLVESRAFIVAFAFLLAMVASVVALYGQQRRIAYAIIAAVVVLIAAFALVNRDRTGVFTDGGDIAAGINHVLTKEVRFVIWSRWAERAMNGPALGVGFGRDVPEKTITPAERQALLAVDPFAPMHSHNIFISVVAETGWPGLAFFLLMLGQVSWQFTRVARSETGMAAQAGTAGLLLIAAMILKNQTDVLMVFGSSVLFYAALGSLLAWPRDRRSFS
ncbi:MAG: O-antigen ligase family protein [Gammaproteobacteria bacterium]|nr:O-antigen ligase family protein [Gammaproteobacteria bacterium]MBU1416024.1 O-antigen ligase family protein [Gammaproteobacteria bacterium]